MADLAIVKDLSSQVRNTYELEGDRLELLLIYKPTEQLRKFVSNAPTIDPRHMEVEDVRLLLGAQNRNELLVGGYTIRVLLQLLEQRLQNYG
ncbi:MAG: hypothetical protein SGPRY_011649 [Prymnesium sp.]